MDTSIPPVPYTLVLSGARWLITLPDGSPVTGIFTAHTSGTGPPTPQQCQHYVQHWREHCCLFNTWAIWNTGPPLVN